MPSHPKSSKPPDSHFILVDLEVAQPRDMFRHDLNRSSLNRRHTATTFTPDATRLIAAYALNARLTGGASHATRAAIFMTGLQIEASRAAGGADRERYTVSIFADSRGAATNPASTAIQRIKLKVGTSCLASRRAQDTVTASSNTALSATTLVSARPTVSSICQATDTNTVALKHRISTYAGRISADTPRRASHVACSAVARIVRRVDAPCRAVDLLPRTFVLSRNKHCAPGQNGHEQHSLQTSADWLSQLEHAVHLVRRMR